MNAKKRAKRAAERVQKMIPRGQISFGSDLISNVHVRDRDGKPVTFDWIGQSGTPRRATFDLGAQVIVPGTEQYSATHTDTPQDMLRRAADIIDQRGKERDSTGKERSMAATVAAFNALEGTNLTERQGWAFMQALKQARAASTARNGRYNPDDYLDGAAYAALGAESAATAFKSQSKKGTT